MIWKKKQYCSGDDLIILWSEFLANKILNQA